MTHLRHLAMVGLMGASLTVEAVVERIEVYPAAFTLHGARERLQLVVTAHHDDGRLEDITHTAGYASADPDLASVSNAVVFPRGDGVTSINVTFGGHQQTVRVTVHHEDQPVSFDYHALPVLARAGCSSGSCHGSPHGKGGFRLSLRAFDRELDRVTLTREEMGRRTNPLDPAQSLVLLKPTMSVAHEGGKRLDKDSHEYQLLKDWIAEGCRVVDPDPVLEGIEIHPPSGRVLLHPARTQQLSVQARFSDGTRRDVTSLCVFSTSDEAVASVTEGGEAEGLDRGEAAIIVRYLQFVESTYLTFVREVPGFAWKDPEPANYIDERVHEKLRQLRFTPAPVCSDHEFIRRVTLDLTGLLPTADETRSFLADTSPDKRARRVEDLLARPEHARFWALKWGDLLRVSRKQIGLASVFKYNSWIEHAFAVNMPYDEFTRRLLTASGSTLLNPAANYYRTAGNTEDAMETSAQLFLGARIQCAKCHNHPFERWTQDDYYGLASVFSQLKRKKTSRKNEEIIWASPDGDIRHPRTRNVMPPWAPGHGVLAVDEGADRRRAFADWLTGSNNPFFAKVEVNRIWAHLMGRGIVEPFDDFRDTNPPSNASLLDALARDFVEHGYDRRHIIRRILNSRTYQASAYADEGNREDAKYFSHYRPRMLTAEQLVDAFGSVTGVPRRFDLVPASTRATQLPAPDLKPRPRDQIGRIDFLKVFGQPERQSACECERGDESSLGQALQLYNGNLLHDMLTSANNRFRNAIAAGQTDAEILRDLYLRALSREPTDVELKRGLFYLGNHADRHVAFEDVCWAILNKTEFLYQH